MIADDLFAGAGGWDLAAAQLGIHARGVENMPEARATRDAAGLTTIHDDVWTFAPDGKATGLIASPPCQTFSAAGKGSGRKALDDVLRGIRDGYVSDLDHLRFLGEEVGDNRTALVLTPLHFALTGGYEWLAWEQVPAVLPVWEACAEVLRTNGWSAWTGKLHAEQYGVPQTRTRAFLLAARSPLDLPTPTHSRYYSTDPKRLDPGVSKWVSMAEALGWHEDCLMRSNYGTGGDSSKRGERHLAEPAPTVTSKINRNRWIRGNQYTSTTGRYYQRHTSLPAPTLTGVVRSWDWTDGSNAPKGTGRAVSVPEASILQSFPADHPWQGAKGKQFLQAGNAVPPLLAEAVLATLVQP